MIRVFPNGTGDRRLIPSRILPKTQKMVLDAAYYKVWIKGKIEPSSPTPQCSSYSKGTLLVTLDYDRQLHFFIFMYQQDLALNNQKGRICCKTQTTFTFSLKLKAFLISRISRKCWAIFSYFSSPKMLSNILIFFKHKIIFQVKILIIIKSCYMPEFHYS